ncbi:putative Ig domain-containing protein [Dyadobacter sp. NIV53]|uniref:putative Ig domain-containing protein n=1 Tax=Dyadobacter sp. NIV53 TaxID=2861765 RepID=UPI001C87D972|nr:putative Ig domain-containing protein [Dyadobacter sp. NIV53]
MHYLILQMVTGKRSIFLLLSSLLLSVNYMAWSQAPSGFSYPTPLSYFANVSNVYVSPTVSGVVTNYALSVFAALPAGLTFNGSTGIISGIATQALATTVYTVTATNSFGSVATNFTMTVTNNYLDNANKQIHLGGTDVVITHPNGSATGQVAGDVTLYQNVATISGYVIDCYVTTKTVVNVQQWLAYDQNEVSGEAYNSNKPDYFSPQVVFGNGGGYINYELQYIFSGTYNSITKSGVNVVLQNVILNTYDLDGNGNPGALQYNEFNGFNTSELGTFPTVAATYNATSNLTKFRSTSINNTANVTAAATRVRVTYLNLSGFSIVVGSEGLGNAFFSLTFPQVLFLRRLPLQVLLWILTQAL